MNELSDRIKEEIEKGISVRGIARKAGMSDNTVRRARDGYELDRATLEKFARYFKVPIEEMYRWAGEIPSMYTSEGRLNRDWVMTELWKALTMMTDAERAELYAYVLRMKEHQENQTGVKQTVS